MSFLPFAVAAWLFVAGLYGVVSSQNLVRTIISLNPLTPILELARKWVIDPHAPGPVALSGGGVRNGLLWRLLEQPFAGIPLQRTDEVGVPADVRKALSFGMLAALTLDGVPASVPSATGAAGSRLLGSITPGSSINWARCLAWMAAQTAPPFCPEI